jgi:hypothetical protein
MSRLYGTRREWVGLLATGAALVALAWAHRFVQDDAFISFRYAQHLARGQGLTWNVGEPPIQGFTNLLWTLLLAGAMRAGIEPVAASYAMGLACFAGTLAGTHATTRALGGSRLAAWTAMVWFGTCFTASSYATGGLETSAQACLVVWATYLALRRRALALSFVAGALVWLRLDSSLLVAVLLGAVAWRLRHDRGRLLALFGPVTLAAAALVAFDLRTFGAVLPNTFYAKVPGFDPRILETGAEYVLAFLKHYALLPYAIFTAAVLLRRAREQRVLLVPVACVVAWTAYVVWVGGDFMEFRFIVPVLPVALALLAVALFGAIASRAVVAALAAALVLGSFAEEYDSYDEDFFQDGVAIETVHGLQAHLYGPDQAWAPFGRELGRAFGHDPRVTIAVGGAGVVPYYSELRTIDVLGLNDAWVARHGGGWQRRAGHRRVAPLRYLIEQHVHLSAFFYDANDPAMPSAAVVVHVPVTPECTADLLYLERSPIVDAVIQREGWTVSPLTR